MYSFASLIGWTPRPTFSDTAITDCHSDTTIFQLRAHWVRTSWSIGSEKSFRHVPLVGVEPSFLRARRAPYPLGQSLCSHTLFNIFHEWIMSDALEEHNGKVSIGSRNITNLWFADDTDVLVEEEQELEALVESLDKTYSRYKMDIRA